MLIQDGLQVFGIGRKPFCSVFMPLSSCHGLSQLRFSFLLLVIPCKFSSIVLGLDCL